MQDLEMGSPAGAAWVPHGATCDGVVADAGAPPPDTSLDRLLRMLAPCAALYDTLHTSELGRLLHLGGTDTRLLTLLAHAGPLGMSRLVQLAPAGIDGTDAALERLSAAGLVARRRAPDDRRTVRAYTDSARASAVLRTPSSTLLRLTRTLGSLTASELAQVCQVLGQLDQMLTRALDAEPV